MGNPIEIPVDAIPKPNSSEENCKRNLTPEVLAPLILGYLQTVTGIDWEVRVKLTEIDEAGEFLNVTAQVNVSVAKKLFGTEPEAIVVPENRDGRV